MADSMFDMVTDILKEDAKLLKETAYEMTKGKPFRKEPMSNEDLVAQYETLPNEVKNYWRMNEPEAWNELENKVLKITGGYNDTQRVT